jgi:hypothetical protein
MRTHLIVLAFVLLASATAFGASKRTGSGLTSFQGGQTQQLSQEEARKKAAGIQDVKTFGAVSAKKETPIPWRGLGLAALLLICAVPAGYQLYKSTRRDLEDQTTFGVKGKTHPAASHRSGKRPPARAKAGASAGGGETRIVDVAEVAEASANAGARDAIWDAISSAPSWVNLDWVSEASNISVIETEDELSALVEEGYVEEKRDRTGKPIFRVVPA